ncbi:hypothetical protein V1504DRAFT_248225 [Lipomyces starkeyi]
MPHFCCPKYVLRFLSELTAWDSLTQQTANLCLIPASVTFFPIEMDCSYDLDLEADVIRAAHVYLVHPVNLILQCIYPWLNIRCKSEVTWTEGKVHSRPDMSWQYNETIFAVLEFKHPYSIDYSEWLDAMTGEGEVIGNGSQIVKQLKKYGYYARTPYVAVFDWNALVLLKLGGNMADWKNDNERKPPATAGQYVWVEQDNVVRLKLLFFLMEALQWRISSS